MTDLNDIKAGTYLLVAKFWDEYLSKPGQPFDFKRHRRGEVLDLNVDDARRLSVAGAVISYDPDAPTHVVNADGTVAELLAPDPAATGMVIPEDQLLALRDQLGLGADATSEDLVKGIQALQVAAVSLNADRPKSDTIKDILEWVGEDKDKANLALEGERSTKGDKARPQLLEALEKLVTAGS